MTRQIMPSVCDGCAKEIKSGEHYSIQFSKKNQGKGNFVKCSNNADMCHTCFMKMCKNGFKPLWIKLQKDDVTGKWVEVDDQRKLNE